MPAHKTLPNIWERKESRIWQMTNWVIDDVNWDKRKREKQIKLCTSNVKNLALRNKTCWSQEICVNKTCRKNYTNAWVNIILKSSDTDLKIEKKTKIKSKFE